MAVTHSRISGKKSQGITPKIAPTRCQAMSDISCLRPANESCFELKAKVKGIHTSHANIFGRSK